MMQPGPKHSDQAKYLTRLQELYFSLQSSTLSPSQRADSLRALTSHFLLAKSQGILSQECESSVLKDVETSYGNIVDCLDEKTGLNNYAEGALAICSKYKNESQQWKSSLTIESIRSKDFYKKVKAQALNISKSFVPTGSENEPVFKHSKNEPAQHPSDTNFPSRTNAAPSAGPSAKYLFSQRGKPSPFPPEQDRDFNQSGALRSAQEEVTLRNSNFGNRKDISREINGDGLSRKRPLFSNSAERNGHGNFESGSTSRSIYRQVQPPEQPARPAETNEENTPSVGNIFKTARQQLAIDQQKKYNRGGGGGGQQNLSSSYGTGKKSLGTRRGPSSKFIPPIAGRDDPGGTDGNVSRSRRQPNSGDGDEPVDERLKGIEPKMIELIMNEIMDHGPQLDWDDVAGLEFAKKTIKEIVVWPMLRPDIFTGLRGPPKGLLLFGPPGTGKTLIGKCIASQSKSTFFSISASSLTSKWVGEGEKMVRALFAVARCNQPAVVFIDEIDSLLSQRSDGEHEASRRIKTEFLVQLDGAGTQSEDRILVIGATNRPQEIDEAARRRFVKRLYIPLPDGAARQQIIHNLLSKQNAHLSEQDLQVICEKTDGYSGADMANLCREAALGPVRSIPFEQIETITADQVPPITFCDFEAAFLQVRASVSPKDLELYIDWNNMYGSFGKM